MAQPGQPPDDDDVRFGDDIDEVLSRANPNPDRIGCPPRETLVGLARRVQPLGDPAYEHLVKCSPCYREFRALQESLPSQSARRSSWSRGWMAVAASANPGRGLRSNVVLQSQRAPAKPTNRRYPIADRRTAHRTRLAQYSCFEASRAVTSPSRFPCRPASLNSLSCCLSARSRGPTISRCSTQISNRERRRMRSVRFKTS